MSTPNSVRFLAAFNAIEQQLRKLRGHQRDLGFVGNLNILSRHFPHVAAYAETLRQYAKLRNIIVHSLREDFVIAEPHDDVVRELELIAQRLDTPLIVADYMTCRPYHVTPQTPVASVLQTFRERDFMRCPVVENGRILGLITAKSVSHWLATLGSAPESSASEISLQKAMQTPAEQLLPYCPRSEYAIVPRRYKLAAAVNRFRESVNRGEYLQCLLVTLKGGANSPLVGIVAPSDLPRFIDQSLSLHD